MMFLGATLLKLEVLTVISFPWILNKQYLRIWKEHLTIWSLMVFPSCSTVRIFCRTENQIYQSHSQIKPTFAQVNSSLDAYEVNSNCADVTFQIGIILHWKDKKKTKQVQRIKPSQSNEPAITAISKKKRQEAKKI
jgi:hypothetical protein